VTLPDTDDTYNMVLGGLAQSRLIWGTYLGNTNLLDFTFSAALALTDGALVGQVGHCNRVLLPRMVQTCWPCGFKCYGITHAVAARENVTVISDDYLAK